MLRVHTVSGCRGGEAYLVLAPRAGVLIDTGFDFCADRLAEQIGDLLGDRSLEYILLTHSHYDHMAGSVGVRDAFPAARVVAHEIVPGILEKDSSRRTMKLLDGQVAADAGEPVRGRIDRLSVDVTAKQGDRLPWAGGTIQVLETPGHTRCCVSYLFEEEGLLALSETTGVLMGDEVVPVFIVGYHMAMDSIDRCAALDAPWIAVPHGAELRGQAARDYFPAARKATREAAEMVNGLHREGMDREDIVRAFLERFFGKHVGVGVPMKAMELNTEAMVSRLLQELESEPLQ